MARAKVSSQAAEVDMTPMIDMTFQLIAFFMVLINFTEAEVNERVKLPVSELAVPPDQPLENPLVLQITQEGTVLLGGDEVQVESLPQYLAREREAIVAEGSNVGEAVVIIRAHEAAKTGKVQDVIKECQKARFERFALRAQEDQ